MYADKRLTCLTCGPYQRGDHVDHAETPGWVQTGGIAGALVTCECCGGMGNHPVTHGTPTCQQTRHVGGMSRAALARWQAESDIRTYASLALVYGSAKAEVMMEQEPPL